MPSQKLTDSIVKSLPTPIKGNKLYFDSAVKGFACRITKAGARSFIVSYRTRAGQERRFTIGQASDWKTADARKEASDIKKRVFYGEDPLGDLEAERAEVEAKRTFKDVAEEFIRRHVDAKGLRSKPEIERCLTKYVYPAWQDRPFLDLGRGDVSKLLDQIVDHNGPRQADMVLAIISKMTRWFQARNDDYVSPVVPGMKRSNQGRGNSRKRILDDGEIHRVWSACEGTFGDVVKVLLLTGQRREKVVTMRWTDIVDGEWRISVVPREKSHAGTLRLPKTVLDIIGQQPRAENPYVFTGRGKSHFNSFSQRKNELDKRALARHGQVMPNWTLHDLRRTARSLMSRAGVRPDIAERVLGHTIAGVEGVYDRYSYVDEKADALNKLATLVERIINPPGEGEVAQLYCTEASPQEAL